MLLVCSRWLNRSLALLALLSVSCGGSAAPDTAGTDTAGTPADAGGTEASAPDGAGGALPAGSVSSHVLGEAPSPVGPPGVYVTSENATATAPSPCASTTLGTVIDAIRASDSTLADIQTLYDPAEPTGDGSFIYAYDVGVLGFDIVFKRGLGDCAAGCSENDYTYFATGVGCLPSMVGQYHSAWGTGTCLTVEGTPMWGTPAPPDPIVVCGVDNSARDVHGTYVVSAQGTLTACAAGATATTIDASLQLVIAQDSQDLSSGSVTFTGTGDPLVDGVALPARFQRQRFDASLMTSLPPDSCPRASSITAHYDLEGYQPGGIDAVEVGDATCGSCQGSMNIALGVASEVP
jgi:hypothetical protein